MDKIKIKQFEKVIAAFSSGFTQDVIAYINTIEQQGFSIQDIKDYHEYSLRKVVKEKQKVNNTHMKCVECSSLMFVYSVNDKSDNQTGDDSKSVWMCQNTKCMHTIYNKESVEKIKSGGKNGKS